MAAPACHFLVCPDGELLAARMAEVLGKADVVRKVFWGDDDQPLPDSFWQDLTITGLFAEPMALVVRRAHLLKVEHWDKLGAAMANKAGTVTVFFCLEGEWKKAAPIPAPLKKRDIFTKAEKGGGVWEQRGLDAQGLVRFVRDWAEKCGLKLAPGADRALASVLPLEARAARLELDKIELAARETGTVETVHAELVASQKELDFFGFTDALAGGGDPLVVWERVLADHRKPAGKQMLFSLLASVAREARIMWMILSGEAREAKVAPFLVNKKAPLARKLGPGRIGRMLDLCLDAELAVKTGQRRTEEALDILVARLTLLYRA